MGQEDWGTMRVTETKARGTSTKRPIHEDQTNEYQTRTTWTRRTRRRKIRNRQTRELDKPWE